MVIVRTFLLGFITLALAACQTTSGTTTAVVTVEKPPLVLPSVDVIKVQDAEWYVITRNAKPNTDGSTEQAFGKSHSDSLLAVTPRGYENFATNQANLIKVIRQYQAQIQAYRDYYAKEPRTDTQESNKNGKSN
jgi:hypothetical protein